MGVNGGFGNKSSFPLQKIMFLFHAFGINQIDPNSIPYTGAVKGHFHLKIPGSPTSATNHVICHVGSVTHSRVRDRIGIYCQISIYSKRINHDPLTAIILS